MDIDTLRIEVERLTKENLELKSANGDAKMMAEALVGAWDMLSKVHVPNYVSIILNANDGSRWELHCLRPGGRTPQELKVVAEAERDKAKYRLEKALDAIHAAAEELGAWSDEELQEKGFDDRFKDLEQQLRAVIDACDDVAPAAKEN